MQTMNRTLCELAEHADIEVPTSLTYMGNGLDQEERAIPKSTGSHSPRYKVIEASSILVIKTQGTRK